MAFPFGDVELDVGTLCRAKMPNTSAHLGLGDHVVPEVQRTDQKAIKSALGVQVDLEHRQVRNGRQEHIAVVERNPAVPEPKVERYPIDEGSIVFGIVVGQANIALNTAGIGHEQPIGKSARVLGVVHLPFHMPKVQPIGIVKGNVPHPCTDGIWMDHEIVYIQFCTGPVDLKTIRTVFVLELKAQVLNMDLVHVEEEGLLFRSLLSIDHLQELLKTIERIAVVPGQIDIQIVNDRSSEMHAGKTTVELLEVGGQVTDVYDGVGIFIAEQ